MNIKIQNVQGASEVNSTFVKDHLFVLFKRFVESSDRLGISKDGVKIDLQKREAEIEESEDTISAQLDEVEKDNSIPSVWALEDDDPDFPVFRPFTTDETGTDYQKALISPGLDIIVLRTEFTEQIRTLKIRIYGQILEKQGTLRELQQYIINEFEYPQNRKELLAKLKEFESDKAAIDSFMIEVPAHKEHVILGIFFE